MMFERLKGRLGGSLPAAMMLRLNLKVLCTPQLRKLHNTLQISSDQEHIPGHFVFKSTKSDHSYCKMMLYSINYILYIYIYIIYIYIYICILNLDFPNVL